MEIRDTADLEVGATGYLPDVHAPPFDLASLLALSTNALADTDLARMNLLCAQGLAGCERAHVTNSLALLDQWAARVKSETERHNYRFERNPAEFENSKGFYKVLILTVVLAEDFHVQYDSTRKASSLAASENDGFFSDPAKAFLHGLLGPKRQGTCSSMPVLYVAVGRRLGYPLKLVTTKGHLFVRWEGEGERFNVEATSHGLNRFADDYYRHWPFEVGASEEAAEGYLKSLNPPEELAVFLSVRGMCLREAGHTEAAAEAFTAAAKLAPEVQSYRLMAERCHGVGTEKGSPTSVSGQ